MKRSKVLQIFAFLLSLTLLSGIISAAGAASDSMKYLIEPKKLKVINNGLDASGNTFQAGYNNTDQYLYFNPPTVKNGEAFSVSVSYSLPAGSYILTAAYKSRNNGVQTAELLCDGVAVTSVTMISAGIEERTTSQLELTLEAGGEHTFTWRVTAGSSNYMTIGNIVLSAYDPENMDTFRFESESTPLITVDSEGVSASKNDVNSWYWTPSLNKSGIQGDLSGDLAYFKSGGIGGYVEYTLPVKTGMKPGEYDLWWSFRPNSQTYSTLDVAFNGASVMEVSQKSRDIVGGLMNMANVMKRLKLGTVEVKADGTDTVRLTMISADGAPTQGFTSDYFELISTSRTAADSAPQTQTVPAASSDLAEAYPLYSGYSVSDIYKVTAGGVSVPVVKYMTVYDYAAFSLKENQPIDITVEYSENITDYSISPLKDEIAGKVQGNKLTFTIDKPTYLIIDINGGRRRLVIAVDEPDESHPDPAAEGVFNVMDYGADPTGAKLSTNAIQAAMDDAAKYGAEAENDQGIVYVPAGVYSVSNIELKSNTNLYISGGAVLRMADDTYPYKYMAQKVSLPGTYMTFMLYTEDHGKNISVTGRGTLDGRGSYTRAMGWTVVLLLLHSAEDFHLDGILFRESGMWAIIPGWSQQVVLENFKVFNNTSFNEDDGVDVVGGNDILVRHAIGITNDDTFSTKTYIMNEGANVSGYGSGPALPLDNVTFEDCTAWSHCYAFKSGQGFAMEQRNLTVKDSVVYDCGVAFGIHHHQNGDTSPHDIRNVVYENIDVEHINYNIWGWSRFTNFIMDTPTNHKSGGNIGEVTVRNINVRQRGTSGSRLQGSTWQGVDWSVNNVTFENIVVEGVLATSLTELGFKGKNSDTYFSNPGLEFVNNSTGCYVINQANAVIPARYYYSGDNIEAAADAGAQTGQTVTASLDTTLRYMSIDFGNRCELLNIRGKADNTASVGVAIDTPDNVVGEISFAAGDYNTSGLPISIAGAHDIYLTLPKGVSIDYIQPYTSLTPDSVQEMISKLPGDEDIDGENFEAAKLAIGSAVTAFDKLTDTEREGIPEDIRTAFAKKQAIAAAGGYSEWLKENAPVLKGDVDKNGTVNVSDIMALKNLIMSGQWTDEQLKLGDMDNSGNLTVGDILAIKNVIMSQT